MTVSELAAAYAQHLEANMKPATRREYTRLINILILPHFGSFELKNITTKAIEHWHLELRKGAPVQANRALAVLSSMLQLAARWGDITANPARGIPTAKETSRERYLTRDEAARLLEAVKKLPTIERVFLRLCLYTGARPGEIASARWEMLTDRTIELPDSKTGRRTIYLSPEAVKALRGLRERPSGPIFPDLDPTLVWRKARRRASLKGVRLYDLRHTFASAALASGASLEVISQLLGHRNPRTTRRYAHLMPETGVKAAAAASAFLSGV